MELAVRVRGFGEARGGCQVAAAQAGAGKGPGAAGGRSDGSTTRNVEAFLDPIQLQVMSLGLLGSPVSPGVAVECAAGAEGRGA